jgi:hypothetical protein
VPARVEQAHRDATLPVDAASLVSVHPDALGAAIDTNFTEQPRREPVWAAGRLEAGPHTFAARSFLDNAAARLRRVRC